MDMILTGKCPVFDSSRSLRLLHCLSTPRSDDRTGRSVGAPEAFSIGLVNRLAPPGEALEVALKLAGEIARHPQRCMRADRMSSYRWAIS
jgi:enoyl-CoA hydratase/carnithine racemase